MSLTPTSKNNPCALCGDTSGADRQGREDLSYWQCMTYADTKKGEIVGGYKCIGATKNKQWAQFKPDNSGEWNEEKRREWQAENQKRKINLEAIAADKKRKSLSAETRNEQYLKLFAELKAATPELAIAHKEDLIRRGLTKSQIELLGAVSVCQYQKIQGSYSELLPGVNTRDNQIISTGDGYLYPVRDVSGLIVGCQIRLMAFNSGLEAPQKSTEKTQKYSWLSGGKSSGFLGLFLTQRQEKGENPLAVYHSEGKPKGVAVGLCEGTGVKPLLASQQLEIPFIGAAGGQHTSSSETLKITLKELQAKYWGKTKPEIKIFPDAGIGENPNVANQLRNAIALVESLGYTIRVAWWGQFSKEKGLDIDELPAEARIQYLEPAKFWDTVAAAKKRWDKIKQEEAAWKAQEPLRNLGYPADIEVSSRYIPHDIISQLPKSGLIGLRAPKGSGKSVLIKALIAIAKTQNITVLSITPRIALGREQAVKWEITWIDDHGRVQHRAESTEELVSKLASQIEEKEGKLAGIRKAYQQLNLLNDTGTTEEVVQQLQNEIEELRRNIDNVNKSAYRTLGLCWDSLWKITEMDMTNSLIIVDEAELGFSHMATGRTCNSNRAKILKIFSSILTSCLTNGGRVILSDADLTSIPIDYIRELLPFKIRPFIVTNTYKGEETRWVVELFKGFSRGLTVAIALAAIRNGSYLALTMDSQAEAEALEREILEQCPEFCRFTQDGEITKEAEKGERPCIIRVDSKTAECAAVQQFIQKPNEQILKWKPRVLIYTPSMGVGVSIDEHVKRNDKPYFDMVVGLFFGVIEPSQCRQQLARIRANIPRMVWVAGTGMPTGGCQSFYSDEINRTSFQQQEWGTSIVDIARANIQDYIGDDGDDGDLIDEVARLKAEHFDPSSRTWNNPHINLFAKLKARNNYGLTYIARLLEEELRAEGHDVINMAGDGNPITEKLAIHKDNICHEDAERLAAAPDVPLSEAKKISRKATATQAERDSAKKALLKDDLPGVEMTPEFLYKAVTKDRGTWLRQHKLFWATQNLDAADERDRKRYFGKLKSFAKGTAYTPDIHMETPKIEVLIEGGVLELARSIVTEKDDNKVYTSNSPEVQLCFQKCLAINKKLKLALGTRRLLQPNSKKISLAVDMLEKIGITLSEVEEGRDGIYRFNREEYNDPDRLAVLEALTKHWILLQQNKEGCDSSALADWQTTTKNLAQKSSGFLGGKTGVSHEESSVQPLQFGSGVYIQTSAKLQEEKAKRECDSGDEDLIEDEYKYSPEEGVEKAREENNSRNLVTESDLGRLYKVRKFEGMFGTVATTPSVTWLPDCRLVELPTKFYDQYIFETPEGKRIAVADEDCFEPMEAEPATTLGERFLAAMRRGLEALRELLGVMTLVEAWTAVDEAGKLEPAEIERLPEIAPDWMSWMPA